MSITAKVRIEERYRLDRPVAVRVDPVEQLQAQLAAGSICSRCMTESTNGGCLCERRLKFRDGLDDADAFYQRLADSGGKDNMPWLLLPQLLAVHRRLAMQASLTDEEIADSREGLVQEWCELWPDIPRMVPRWRPYRRSEATHLPI